MRAPDLYPSPVSPPTFGRRSGRRPGNRRPVCPAALRTLRAAEAPGGLRLFLLGLLVFTAALLAVGAAEAQEAPLPPEAPPATVEAPTSAASTPSPAASSGLRRAVEALFEVKPIAGGVELVPREERDGIESVTLVGDEIRINGSGVPRSVAQAWLDRAAAPVLALADLSPAERRRTFGLSTEGLRSGPPSRPAEMGTEGEATEAPDADTETDERLRAEADEDSPLSPREVEEIRRRAREDAEAARERAEEIRDRVEREVEAGRRGDPYRTGGQFNIFDDLVIPEDESATEAVAVIGSVEVNGEVRGDVTAVLGSVEVNGRVEGEVTAVNGDVVLGPEAEVLRGVTAVGGEVRRASGARVRGEITEVPIGGGRVGRSQRGWMLREAARPIAGIWELFWKVMGLLTLGLVLALTLLLAPRVTGGVAERATAEWWRAGLVGGLTLVLFIPALIIVCLVLIISIVGIPVLLLFVVLLPFLLIAVALLSYAGVSLAVGRWIQRRASLAWTSPYSHLLLGLLALEALRTVGHLTSSVGGAASMVGWPMTVVGEIIVFVAFLVGLGALVMGRLPAGYGGRHSGPAAVPPGGPGAPPPPPPPPVAMPPIESHPAPAAGPEPHSLDPDPAAEEEPIDPSPDDRGTGV